jgi:hypothetical protein
MAWSRIVFPSAISAWYVATLIRNYPPVHLRNYRKFNGDLLAWIESIAMFYGVYQCFLQT